MIHSLWAVLLISVVLPGLGSGCSSAPRKLAPELSELQGKKIALTEVDGEETARKVVEVALINQLNQRGTFEMIAKQDVEDARAHFEQDPTDWKGVAKRAGADFALRARVLEFETKTQEGHDLEIIEDSQWEQERGEKTRKNLYRVRSLIGKVRVQLEFAELAAEEGDWGMRTAVAEHHEVITLDARKEAIHLPPRLRFLEGICNRAFQKFFDEYR